MKTFTLILLYEMSAGYDLTAFANEKTILTQMPLNLTKDYRFMWQNNEHFMSLFYCPKPVTCKNME